MSRLVALSALGLASGMFDALTRAVALPRYVEGRGCRQ